MWNQQAYGGMMINIIVIIWSVLLVFPVIKQYTDSVIGLYVMVSAMACIYVVFSFVTFIDIFPVLAFIIGRIGEARCQNTPQNLRKYYAAAEVCWLAYGLSIGIWAACLKTGVGLASALVAIYWNGYISSKKEQIQTSKVCINVS